MAISLGYLLLGAGFVVLLMSLSDDPRRSKPLKFAAAMLVVGGLAILQFEDIVLPQAG